MTLYEFNLLGINNQMETVNQQGVYLDNHITKNEEFNLYAINMFFVEACYNSLENKISGIKSGNLSVFHWLILSSVSFPYSSWYPT
ncbi:MAG: hypothetical protein ACJAYY_000087 [Paraglaciecola sp.]|jgi:hypothetical protein|uniref:hypothetical protein n=1 Tax=Polaribacter sp. TaxID=1920175 RepID=UPI003ACF8274